MNAEKRRRFLDLYFHIVLASFALSSIGISVLNRTHIGPLKEDMLTFTSITTLCLSLLIFGFKFGETAANHRSCYLALQKLRATKYDDLLSLEQDYIEILGHYPNHTHGDYLRLAVSNIWGPTQDLESPPGRKVTFDCWDRLVYVVGWFLARVTLILFAIMPLVMALYGIDFLTVSLISP